MHVICDDILLLPMGNYSFSLVALNEQPDKPLVEVTVIIIHPRRRNRTVPFRAGNSQECSNPYLMRLIELL